MKTYLVNYQIGYDQNQAYFSSESKAKAFVDAIRPLVGERGLFQVFTVDAAEPNFFHV